MDDGKLATSIGKSARAARVALGLSQADVAEKLGLSLEFVGRIERGVALPSVPTLVSLVQVLGVSSDALLGLSSERVTHTHRNAPPREQSRIRRLLDRRLNRAPDSALRVVNLLLAEFESSAKTSRRNVHRSAKKAHRNRTA
jgi:transcriptional regulator with XRE-family HTH domain